MATILLAEIEESVDHQHGFCTALPIAVLITLAVLALTLTVPLGSLAMH